MHQPGVGSRLGRGVSWRVISREIQRPVARSGALAAAPARSLRLIGRLAMCRCSCGRSWPSQEHWLLHSWLLWHDAPTAGSLGRRRCLL